MPQGSSRKKRQAYKDLFASELGQRVLDDLIIKSHILEPVATPEEEGERRLVLYILNMVHWKETELQTKIKEMVKNG